MENMRPSPFVANSEDGANKVYRDNGHYAYIMESVSIEYRTERNCSFMQLGGLLDSKGFGIALKKGKIEFSTRNHESIPLLFFPQAQSSVTLSTRSC
jgi:hypothetical protein